jgi:hypothetical protein
MDGLGERTVYVLIDPRDHQVRYVGVTKGTLSHRLRQHMASIGRGTHRAAWLSKLRRMGLRPYIEQVQVVPASDWVAAERYWIGFYRTIGCPLTNTTNGGEGFVGTPAARAKIGERLRGRPKSPEHRAKLSEALMGHSTGRKGVFRHTEETKAKIRAARASQVFTPEQQARSRAAHPRGASHPFYGRRVLTDPDQIRAAQQRSVAARRANRQAKQQQGVLGL